MRRVAVITGASSGIGEATARLLAVREPGTEIVLVARREERIVALADELNRADPAGGDRVRAVAADLIDSEDVTAMVADLRARGGRVDLLVNNAGARWSAPFATGGAANIAQTMAINFDAPVRLTEALLPLLRGAVANGVGPAPVSIVNVASTAARVARPGTGAYSASKFALAGWSDSLRAELAPEGIHVGAVYPGFIATEGFPAAELLAHPLKRHMVGSAEQAAEAILAVGLTRRAEAYVPRFYWAFAALRILAPGVIRRAVAGGGLNTATTLDAESGDSA